MRDLTALFNPKSVVLIGASSDPNKMGAIILQNIMDSKYTGRVYPVNPNFETVQNLKCYKNIKDIPDVPDLAVIAIPAFKNPEVLIEIGEKGIENVLSNLRIDGKGLSEGVKYFKAERISTNMKFEKASV